MRKFISTLSIVSIMMLTSIEALAGSETISLPRRDGKQTPVRLYGDWQQCLPTVILSHGMGGDETGLAYVGEAAAKRGYRALAMGHAESGRSALRGIIFTRKSNRNEALLNPVFWQGRFDDLDAAITYATQNCRPPLMALAGHSMGAATTMLEAGARGRVDYGGRNRFDAYVAISPQGVSWMFADSSAWNGITKPVLLITGTEDSMNADDYQNRAKVLDYLPKGLKRLVVIDGATHMALGGRRDESVAATSATAIFDYLDMLKNNAWVPVQYPNTTVKDK
jgi:predicted dienelactone hydrolase